MSMHRFNGQMLSVAVTNSEATTGKIGYHGCAGGEVYVPAGSALTLLTWYASWDDSGTFVAAQDGAGNAVTSTVAASVAVPIPAPLFGARCLKAVGNDTGTINVTLKS
jgi:hypothetical protein